MFVCFGICYRLLCRRCNMIAVFDLDNTVIDSSHRALTKGGGEIDLANWRTHTREQILSDTSTPFAQYMRRCIANPRVRTWICTSRNLKNADYEMLAKHGLADVDVILSRKEGDNRNDVEFKKAKLSPRLNLPHIKKTQKLLFDDREDIREMAERLGFTAPPPHSWSWYL